MDDAGRKGMSGAGLKVPVDARCPARQWRARVEFKVADLWVGVFWKRTPILRYQSLLYQWDVWLCILPMVPLHVAFVTGWTESPKPIAFVNWGEQW